MLDCWVFLNHSFNKPYLCRLNLALLCVIYDLKNYHQCPLLYVCSSNITSLNTITLEDLALAPKKAANFLKCFQSFFSLDFHLMPSYELPNKSNFIILMFHLLAPLPSRIASFIIISIRILNCRQQKLTLTDVSRKGIYG